MALADEGEHLWARRLDSPRALLVVPPSRSVRPVPAERFALVVSACRPLRATLELAGTLSAPGLDLAALDLEPLTLVDHGPWDPARDQLGAGPPPPPARREMEMERIPPAGPAETALHRALDLWRRGREAAAVARLGELLRRDLRSLEAHSCLGFFAIDAPPRREATALARRHWAAGLAIGDQALGEGFTDVLPWARPGNRPFLRCLHGHATCLWRLGELDAARAGFERLCALNPGDQLAARLALERIELRNGP